RVSFSPHNQKTSSRKVRKNPVLNENQHHEHLTDVFIGRLPPKAGLGRANVRSRECDLGIRTTETKATAASLLNS
ncbi:hypothetical protein, partial [Acetobacter estunensis]|uniref:hypothetical protein n=1 Tax=Acetobacter estunensis TaxID=104097 RepID=UPI00223189F9